VIQGFLADGADQPAKLGRRWRRRHCAKRTRVRKTAQSGGRMAARLGGASPRGKRAKLVRRDRFETRGKIGRRMKRTDHHQKDAGGRLLWARDVPPRVIAGGGPQADSAVEMDGDKPPSTRRGCRNPKLVLPRISAGKKATGSRGMPNVIPALIKAIARGPRRGLRSSSSAAPDFFFFDPGVGKKREGIYRRYIRLIIASRIFCARS